MIAFCRLFAEHAGSAPVLLGCAVPILWLLNRLRVKATLVVAMLWGTLAALSAQTVQETFTTDPVANGRFGQQTTGTESAFTYNSATGNLTAVVDVDASAAFFLSSPFLPITDQSDASFSARFRIDAVDDQEHPAAFLGLMTDVHVGNFGDGLLLVISMANGSPVANADLESFDQSYSGTGVPLQLHSDYLAVGRFRAATRQFAVEIFNAAGFTNLLGFSTLTLPQGSTLSVNRLGLQNAGARDIDSDVGSITLVLDDLFTPASNPHQISIQDATVQEGNAGTTNAVFALQLSPASSLPITVDFMTVDGTATAGSDYLRQAGSLTFLPGTTSAEITVPVNGDVVHEDNETFSVQLSNPLDAALSRGTALGTILDDDPVPLISIEDVAQLEGDLGLSNFEFVVSLSSPSGQPVSVDFATSDGSALSGLDYLPNNGTLFFAPGQTIQRVVVGVLGDSLVESDETFFVNLSNSQNATVLKGQGVGTIFDDDSVPRLSINDVSVVEGNSGLTPAVFTIALTRPSSLPVRVDYALASGTASVGSDLLAGSGTLTIPAGAQSVAVTVSVIGDTVPELDETFTVNLSNPQNATVAKAIGVGTIRNDDAFPELSILDVSVPEGDSGSSIANLPVKLSFPLALPVTVHYTTSDGTAVAGADYLSQTGTLTFPAGTVLQNISVDILGDTLNEADETFFVTLSAPSLATIGRDRASATILNDDPVPALSIDDVAVTEGDAGLTAATFTLRLSAPSAQLVQVSFATADGTALAGSDYVPAFGAITFPPGTTTRPVTVMVKGDMEFEPDETFFLRLGDPVHATLTRTQGVGTIRNDDPMPEILSTGAAVTETEGGTVAVLNVTLSEPSNQAPVTVGFATADGTAIAGSDYVQTSGVLTFAPGVTQAQIRIPVLDDLIHENDEAFFVNFGTPTNAVLATAQARVTIADNDPLPKIYIRDAQVLEGDSGTARLIFAVELDRPSALRVSAQFGTRDDTATVASLDYLPASGQVQFEPGVTNAIITVLVNGDLLPEPDETLFVDLSQLVEASEGRSHAVGTILDDDTKRITISDVSVAEGLPGTTTNAVFALTLNKPSDLQISVQFSTSDGTATANSDYLPTSGVVTFNPGETRAEVVVAVLGEDLLEADEMFFVNLTAPVNAVLARPQGTGTIINDEDKLVIAAAGLTVLAEDCAPANHAIDPGETVTVSFGLVNIGTLSSATVVATLLGSPEITPLSAAQTYGVLAPKGDPVGRTFRFQAHGDCGQTLQAVLQVQNGGTNYGPISFSFLLGANVAGRVVCCNSAELAITATADLKTVVVNHPLTYSLQVSNSGPKAATAVRMTNVWRGAVTLLAATPSQGTATIQDQSLIVDLGTIAAGSSATVQVGVAPQQVTNLIGIFQVRSADNDPDPSNNTATVVTVVTPPPGISINNTQVVEGNTRTNAVFTVQLSSRLTQDVKVDYATSDGTAVAGQDYTPTFGTVTIAAGTTTASISVPVIGDSVVEMDETFFVTLSNALNAPLAAEQTVGTATILDDDFPVLTVDDVMVTEPALGAKAQAVLVLRLTPPPLRPVTVDFATADGTAHAPGDYQAASGQVTFLPNTATTNLTVEVEGDTLVEPDEVFFLNFTHPVAVNLARTQSKITIVDNSPSGLPQISLSGTAVVEGPARTSTNAVFKLSLSRPSPLPVLVDYVTANGSALGGSDYVITSGTVAFAPGQTNAQVAVLVKGDDVAELDETFSLLLSNPVNATLAVARADGRIINDDYLPLITAAGTQLILENCQPPNQAIDPLETVTVNFAFANRGLGPTTNLVATLLANPDIRPLSNPQNYGALPTNGVPSARPFTFMILGACGEEHTAEVELFDSGYSVGSFAFRFVLGVQTNGQSVCCSSADLAVSVLNRPGPDQDVPLHSPLLYTIGITNLGPSVATEVLLTNRFSAPVEFSSTAAAISCLSSNNQWVCQLGSLAPGASLVITNSVRPAALGALIDFVLVAAHESDPNSDNNIAIAGNRIVPATGIAAEDITVLEGDVNTTVPFPLLLWPARNLPVTVDFTLADGTAKAGADYLAQTGTVTFAPGATSAVVAVTIVGDRINEPTETFSIQLSNPTNGELVRAQAFCTIIDNDPPVISFEDVEVNVGTNRVASAVLVFRLSALSTAEVQLQFATLNGTAAAGTDYAAQSGVLIFSPGELTKSITIPISGNTLDESTEHFFVSLVPTNATVVRPQAIVTITDQAPVDLSVLNALPVAEGNSGFQDAVFQVRLGKPIAQLVSVQFFTSDGTALSGSDYVATTGTLSFAPGDVQKEVHVPIIGDLINEPDETFYLNLTNALNGVIRSGRAVAVILNDDALPCLSMLDRAVQEGNSGTNFVLMPLHLSVASAATVSVEVVWPGCRSALGSELDAIPELVVFAPGQTERTVAVPILGDMIHEPNETCLIRLTNAVNAQVCGASAQLTIIDDDPLPGLEISDAVPVLEGNTGTTAAIFTVSLVGRTSQTVTVRYTTSDGTANSPSDYIGQSGLITFPPGSTATNISVLVNGDLTVEPDETFFVTLSQPENATLFASRGTATILNDDAAPRSDCPSVLVLATPGNQTCFAPFSPITLSARPDAAADQIVQMEFYSGSTLLGIDSSSPFQIVWDGAEVGDYCVTAKALCQSGRTIHSEPLCLGVTMDGAAVAIIRNFDDPEISRLREYLLEMGYCARVFDQEGLRADQLTSFQLVIWDDLGAEGLTDGTVQVLGQLFTAGTPLFLIGDRLVSSSNQLTPATRGTWSQLLHLSSLNQSGAPGQITFSSATENRQPGTILTGRFADVANLPYSNVVADARGTADATPLAFANSSDLLVQYPTVDTPDVGQARSVSQTFRVVTGGDSESIVSRKGLFQNSVCWLLRCSYCPLIKLALQHSAVSAAVNVGDEFTFNLTISNNGECIASATIVTNRLPAGLGFVSATYNQGIGIDYNPTERTLVWRVGSVVSGSENDAILTLTLRALQPGTFQNVACGIANYEKFSTSNCTEFDLRIDSPLPPQPAQLTLLRSTAGILQLRLDGQQGASYQVQRSPDLSSWLTLTNVPGPLFFLDLPETGSAGSNAHFYRAR